MGSAPPQLAVDDFRRLLAATAAVTGDDFFRGLVKALGELLQMRCVFVAEVVGPDAPRLRPLALWRAPEAVTGAAPDDVAEHALAGTPWERLLEVEGPVRSMGGLDGCLLGATDLGGLAALGSSVRRADGRAVGVLCVFGDPAVVAAADADIVAIFASRAAAEVERVRADAEFRALTDARLRYQSALVELAQLRATRLEPALRVILRVSARTLGVERASYWSLVDHDEAIECEQLYTLSDGKVASGGRLAAATYPAYFEALRTCLAIDAEDARSDPRTCEFRVGYFDVFGIGAMLDVPVWRGGRLVGVHCIEHVGGARSWSSEEQAFAASVATTISLVLEAQARTRAEERYRLVSQATGEAVWEWDLRTDYIVWNDALHTVFGHAVDLEMCGGNWWIEHIHPSDRERVTSAIHAVIDGETNAWSDEYRFARGDESMAHVLDRGFVTRDEAGRALRMTGSMQDVTARKALEARLLLGDRMASMGTLAAGVAHEINNPLAYIKGNLDYVLEKLVGETGLDPDVVLALEDAREGANRVRAIVRDLKMFSRADVASKGPVDVEAVVTDSIAMAWNEIRHRARLVRHAGNPPPVLASEARLGQVVLNLVVNAAQAIPEGATDANEIRVQTGVAADGRVFIEVADTGVGITPETQRRMFDPFFTTKAIGDGTGLGLSICHAIVTELGGEISVQTEPGRGTTLRVLLAAATPVTAVLAAPDARPAESRSARMLVIDDDVSVGATVKRVFARDHHVEVCVGGAEALARLALDEAFDIIICDVMMPDVSGMDVYATLAARAPELARRMIFITGGAFTPRAREFFATTSQPCIEKPFDREELRRAVAAMTSLPATATATATATT